MQRLFLGLVLAGLLWAIGLTVFIGNLSSPSQSTAAGIDGVVIYTGGGGKRIEAGMALFANGSGHRLLISGVHPDTSRSRLSDLWEGPADLFNCCVDLGREALSTIGNATELNQWATENKYNAITLVTSDYHMPRSMTSTRARMPDIEIYPYVVASGLLDEAGRPTTMRAWQKLAGEYTKYILACINALFQFNAA